MKLILGDCLEKMKEIPDNSIDMVLTDPPYGIGIAEWDSVDYYDFIFQESYRVLKDGCYGFVFSTKKNMKRPNFKHDIFAVIKNFAQFRQHLGMFDAWYPIIYFIKGKPRKIHLEEYVVKRNWYLLNTANTSRNKDNPKTGNDHVTPKNITLINHLVKCHSLSGDTVLDMFMGSGTTGVACKNLNREFIRIEKDENYFNIAKQRIEQ